MNYSAAGKEISDFVLLQAQYNRLWISDYRQGVEISDFRFLISECQSKRIKLLQKQIRT